MVNDKKQFIFNKIDNSNQSNSINSPLGNNGIKSLAILFEDREYYSDIVIPQVNHAVKDIKIFGDLINENSLYGSINSKLEAIYAKKQYVKEIPSADEKSKYALNFVADAFNAMNKYLLDAALIGKLSKESVFYKLKAYNAFTDFQVILDTNDILNFNEFINKIDNNIIPSWQIKNINDFNKSFILHLKQRIVDGASVTKSSILFDSFFVGYTSGLIIDIAKDRADDDTTKYEKYFLDSGFTIFADACKRFGFLIDKNVPWKLIADLSSPAIISRDGNHVGYMLKYGLNSVEDMYSKYFNKCHTDDLEYLKKTFYDFYNVLITNRPYYELDYKKLEICDFNNQTVFARDSINLDKFKEAYPDTYWMRVLVYLKNYEDKRNLSQQQFENIVREANNFVKAGRTQNALEFINEYFKEFKNVQYLSSLQNKNKELQQIADNKPSPQIIF